MDGPPSPHEGEPRGRRDALSIVNPTRRQEPRPPRAKTCAPPKVGAADSVFAGHANCLVSLQRHAEAKCLLRKTRHGYCAAWRDAFLERVVKLRFMIRKMYARASPVAGATLDDLRVCMMRNATLEELTRTARRVLGGAHATTVEIEDPKMRGSPSAPASNTQGWPFLARDDAPVYDEPD